MTAGTDGDGAGVKDFRCADGTQLKVKDDGSVSKKLPSGFTEEVAH